jgi:hypothetical protein
MIKLRQVIASAEYLVHQSIASSQTELNTLVTILLSENLCCMSDYFLSHDKLDLAKLAAFWSVEKILKINLKVEQVANSFAALLKVLRVRGETYKYKWVYKSTQIQIARALFCSKLNMEGLAAVARAYTEVMICGWVEKITSSSKQ